MKQLLKKLYHSLFFNTLRVFIDLGTTQTRIAIKNKGLVLKEPTYLAYHQPSKQYVFVGQEAKDILGKTPEFLTIVRPIRNSIVSEFDAEVALINTFFHRSVAHYFKRYSIIKPPIHAFTAYPVTATEIEQKAVEEVLLKAGCSKVNMVLKPLATAAGCEIDIFSHKPCLLIDLGGGLIEIAIISGGGIVSSRTIKNAGEHMDKLIANYLYLKHGVVLGEATCEKLKHECFHFEKEECIMVIRGKSLENGLPKSLKVKTSEIREALLPSFFHIVEVTKELIELSPPEIVEEIYEHGIILAGAMAKMKGIADFFQKELEIKTQLNMNFAQATIHGLIQLDKEPSHWHHLNPIKTWM